MKHVLVLMAIVGLFCFLVITLTTSPPATAVSLSDQHYSHTFTVGNDTWAYVDIDRTKLTPPPIFEQTRQAWVPSFPRITGAPDGDAARGAQAPSRSSMATSRWDKAMPPIG